MKIKIEKGLARGSVKAPPSKSYAHRLLICAALSQGESRIEGISQSEDVKATLDCIRALGIDFTKTGDTVSINGMMGDGEYIFNCRESGSTLRFFIPIALLSGKTCVFTGTERLMARGIGLYEELLASCGITFIKEKDRITAKGRLKPGYFSLRGDVSSQYISGLLFALPLLDGDSVISITTELESAPYVDITIECLRSFGVEIEKGSNTYYIRGKQAYKPCSVTVEGDYSNAAFLDGFNILGGDVSVLGLNENSLQGDKIYREYFKLIKSGTPTVDISACPDLGPVLFALASACNGATFVGTKRLKIKESDRAEAMKAELMKLGVKVEIFENSVKVSGGAKAPEGELNGHNDHRIVMALALLLSRFGGVIDGCEAVSKSYPDFFDIICKLGIGSEFLSENN